MNASNGRKRKPAAIKSGWRNASASPSVAGGDQTAGDHHPVHKTDMSRTLNTEVPGTMMTTHMVLHMGLRHPGHRPPDLHRLDLNQLGAGIENLLTEPPYFPTICYLF